MRYWYLRVAPRWELFASWSAENWGSGRRFFQVERDKIAGELHLWLGYLKIEWCRSLN